MLLDDPVLPHLAAVAGGDGVVSAPGEVPAHGAHREKLVLTQKSVIISRYKVLVLINCYFVVNKKETKLVFYFDISMLINNDFITHLHRELYSVLPWQHRFIYLSILFIRRKNTDDFPT